MTPKTPFQAAVIRGVYLAAGTGFLTFLLTYQSTQYDARASIVAGCIAGLSALGFRAMGEGMYDQRRADLGLARSSDVGQQGG